jgi:hypothetical protein
MNFFAKMLLMMLAINVFLGLIDFAIVSVNPAAAYFNVSGTTAGTLTEGGLSGSLNNNTDYEDIPTSDAISEDSDNIFTDTFKSIKNFMNTLEEKLGVLTSIFKQPQGFMKQIGFPAEIYVSFGIIWWALAIIAFIMMLRGDG